MSDSGQVNSSAAEIYDEFFLPALFAQWPQHVIGAAQIQAGMRVLDVACGTGVLTIEAAAATSPGGAVVGVDLNPGMLAVARKKAPGLTWLEAPAESLPLDSNGFDAVISQFGLMFFQDQRAAIREMWRVLRPGGHFVVAVWDAIEHAPGYAAVTALLARLFGDAIADSLRAPYALGDAGTLQSLFRDAGVEGVEIQRLAGDARFPSIRSWMHTDVKGWTLADKIDDEQFERLVAEAERELECFKVSDGSVRFDHPALLVCTRKPSKPAA